MYIYLKQKYHLHILSKCFRNITHEKVNGSIIKEYVETITTAEDAGVAKPHRDAFQKAIDQTTDATAENSVYIGDDWIADMVGASRFGMRAIRSEERRVGKECSALSAQDTVSKK